MFTKEEAIKFMMQGIKMTHELFTPGEWVTYYDKTNVIFEDGCKGSIGDFWGLRQHRHWLTGWDVYAANYQLK